MTSGPRKFTAKRSRPRTVAKKDFLRVLRTAGIPEETIRTTDEQLQETIDLKRDAVFLVRHGLDRDQLMDRMGASP
jgi:hypothetical protein